jgi:hypothetical protein
MAGYLTCARYARWTEDFGRNERLRFTSALRKSKGFGRDEERGGKGTRICHAPLAVPVSWYSPSAAGQIYPVLA